ncbi:MAG: DUF167 domain-containing protein [Kiritimatiellia bacterium]|jgi:uncharacterized protein (TIGR00251 family)
MSTKEQHTLELHIVPRAGRTEICGRHGSAVKIRLHAPPVDGKANRALLEFLGQTLDMPISRLTLVSGAAGRRKRVRVDGLSEAEVYRRLGLSPL